MRGTYVVRERAEAVAVAEGTEVEEALFGEDLVEL